ncbi:MAG TPA: universal stress protein [Gaiellaceae bacterium]
MRTILLATDGSPGARLATHEAIALAAETGRPLRIVSVWAVPSLGLSATPSVAAELGEFARDHAQEALDAAAEEAADAGIAAITYLRHGEAAHEILEVAEMLPGVLVVVGSNGRGAIGRAILGSVATRLVHTAPYPVMVVRSSKPARLAEQHAGAPAITARGG